jgi:hypothetical protein
VGNEAGDDEPKLHDVDQSADEVSGFLSNFFDLRLGLGSLAKRHYTNLDCREANAYSRSAEH